LANKVDEILKNNTQHIDFSEFYKSKVLTEYCPVRRVHIAQLAANNPLEDRWNLGFIQVDGSISSFVCTVLDGHTGSACSHALAWVALDYIAAAFLDDERLEMVLPLLPKNLTDQPYHPVRRLSSTDSSGHTAYTAMPPPPDVKLHFRRMLRRFVAELLTRRERNSKLFLLSSLGCEFCVFICLCPLLDGPRGRCAEPTWGPIQGRTGVIRVQLPQECRTWGLQGGVVAHIGTDSRHTSHFCHYCSD
uniref:PPM-type phosphatase domain-containing protein n=1 Tax=Schistocephalus solidus TaxID=70667 RepID=A0A183TFW7_SCHSO